MNQPMSGYVVGAYAATPTAGGWDPELESQYYAAVAADARVAGFELPWLGALHPHDEEWLIANLPAPLTAVITDVPHVFPTVLKQPTYGLASADEEGRAQAMADARRLKEDVRRLHQRLGRQAVHTVELHAGPRADQAGVEPLVASLTELAGWDWDGAELVLEHSDALVAGQTPEKGFLPLADEIAAIQQSGTQLGVTLNWGRSALELRDPNRVVEHIAQAREAGLLRGFLFSGVTDTSEQFGRPWADAHNPFRASDLHGHGDEVSLLTDDLARDAIAALDPQTWLGIKMSWPAGGTEIEDRVAMLHESLDALDRVR
ncbi:DUF4862 family protein [Parenemella sanctibonifatiensis]|uniref:DUF4862 domain-containing protein n=1 Tax=Parenemella sanctibonifatiensis TaxID=2016505 RepID=A0A255EK97_9ACTN|nr:DUF4862 family protein [Parenemella sanctibonifatiensis]OYN91391.1 DUF4862 domain-containing protein [Parenemella sanctibonifatiensis]